ncbi:MAG: hypothetical protein EOO46_13160 [Flavobacterium sp.]|nr:MAG: hypothetical protein EOO46_13160 [Flavobacterium sp.]
MTEGENFIKEFLDEKKIKYRPQQPIDGLENDSKSHRIADFYLPEYNVYLEYFGQWGVDSHKERYREKRQVYISNQIPCILLYPENLGIIKYVFEKRMLYILKRYRLEKELKKFQYKILWEEKHDLFFFVGMGIGSILVDYPWKNVSLFTAMGIAIIVYQLSRLKGSYKRAFRDNL